MPSPNGEAPYGSCRFWIWIPYWLWSFPEPLQSSKATSYSNFFYSNHVGVMQWAHNISAAALSHQVSDLRMAQGVYLQHTLTSISVWYFPISSCHHDTSIGLLHFVALFPKHISASCVEQDCGARSQGWKLHHLRKGKTAWYIDLHRCKICKATNAPNAPKYVDLQETVDFNARSQTYCRWWCNMAQQ